MSFEKIARAGPKIGTIGTLRGSHGTKLFSAEFFSYEDIWVWVVKFSFGKIFNVQLFFALCCIGAWNDLSGPTNTDGEYVRMSKMSLQLNGHHKSKQKRDLLCSAFQDDGKISSPLKAVTKGCSILSICAYKPFFFTKITSKPNNTYLNNNNFT